MNKAINVLKSSILAGCCIGLGGYVYLTVGGLAGAVLFAFGLITVVGYKLHLFTGKSGFFDSWKSLLMLFTAILFGNVIGCYLMSLIASPTVLISAESIVAGRLSAGLWSNFLLAIPCGFIMTTAVEFAKREKPNYLPLLFGVPLFIMCGFRHSIADAFYYCCSPALWSSELLLIWIVIIIGNFIGCNIYRVVMSQSSKIS